MVSQAVGMGKRQKNGSDASRCHVLYVGNGGQSNI